jgi:DNA-binding response OmpR family regulator
MTATILVVDDTAVCRDPMERLLNAQGYAARTATNGLEALDVLRSFTPDLMLLDLAMPLMDGFELLGCLRRTPRLATLLVIVVTGETSPETQNRARELGARDVLFKGSFRTDELFTLIRRELAGRKPEQNDLESTC